MNIRFHSSASVEYVKAVEYYEKKSRDVCLKFIVELELSIAHLKEYSESGVFITKNERHCLTNFHSVLFTAWRMTE